MGAHTCNYATAGKGVLTPKVLKDDTTSPEIALSFFYLVPSNENQNRSSINENVIYFTWLLAVQSYIMPAVCLLSTSCIIDMSVPGYILSSAIALNDE